MTLVLAVEGICKRKQKECKGKSIINGETSVSDKKEPKRNIFKIS